MVGPEDEGCFNLVPSGARKWSRDHATPVSNISQAPLTSDHRHPTSYLRPLSLLVKLFDLDAAST